MIYLNVLFYNYKTLKSADRQNRLKIKNFSLISDFHYSGTMVRMFYGRKYISIF